MLLCVAVCCRVLQGVAERFSAELLCMCCSNCSVWCVQILAHGYMMQCVAVNCSVLQCVVVWCSVLQCVQCVAVCYSVLQCVAVCCSVLQCVAVCCSVL